MSTLQKFLVAVLPKSWAENLEAESRQWTAHCPCGFERSYWETGGVRWKGAGTLRIYLTCPRCGFSLWQTVSKKPQAHVTA
jgi:hypothetical protein